MRVPFTSIVERLQEACQLQLESDAKHASLPKKPRVKKRQTSSDSEVARLQEEIRGMKEALRNKERELRNKDREMRNKDRELRPAERKSRSRWDR